MKNRELPEYDNWTVTAIQCLKSGFDCQNCKLPKQLETLKNCRMREVVEQLIVKKGMPEI